MSDRLVDALMGPAALPTAEDGEPWILLKAGEKLVLETEAHAHGDPFVVDSVCAQQGAPGCAVFKDLKIGDSGALMLMMPGQWMALETAEEKRGIGVFRRTLFFKEGDVGRLYVWNMDDQPVPIRMYLKLRPPGLVRPIRAYLRPAAN